MLALPPRALLGRSCAARPAPAAPLAGARAPARRSRARQLRCRADAERPPRSAWLPTAPPSPATAHLLALLDGGCDRASFRAAVDTHTLAVAAAAPSAESLLARLAPPPGAPPEAALAARIATLRATAARAAEVEALLALSVAAAVADAGAALHAAAPPPRAPPLPRGVRAEHAALLALLPNPDAARELAAHAAAVLPPGSDPDATVRLDSASGARLYAGSIQFGYFVASVFHHMARSGGGGSDGLAPDALRRLAQSTRSAEAWGAAARRAGALWALPPDADGGYSALSEFSTGVTLAPAAALSEWYDTLAGAGAGADSGTESPAAGVAAAALPAAAALRALRAGALRDLAAEAALWGWHLAAAERALADDPRTTPLLTPRTEGAEPARGR
jgi:hypothetical protein